MFAGLLVCVACSKSDIVGTWEWVNNNIQGDCVLEFNAGGTGRISATVKDGSKEVHDFKWTRDGDKIYLAAEGEKEVGVYEVVSADGKTLVLSVDGDLHYFKKKSSNIFSREEKKEEESDYDDIFGGY